MARHTSPAFNFIFLLFAFCLLPRSLAGTFYNSSSTTSTSSTLGSQLTSSTSTSAFQFTTYLTTTPPGKSATTITSIVRPSPSGPTGSSSTNSPAIQSSSNNITIQHPFFLLLFCAWAAWVLASFQN